STSYYALHLVHCSPFSLLHHTPPTNIYSLSLHDALPISRGNQTGNADWLAVDVVDLAAWHLVGIIGLRDNQVREETEVFRGTLRSEEHTSELQSRFDLVCRLLLEKKKKEKKASIGEQTNK